MGYCFTPHAFTPAERAAMPSSIAHMHAKLFMSLASHVSADYNDTKNNPGFIHITEVGKPLPEMVTPQPPGPGVQRTKIIECQVGDWINILDFDADPKPIPGTDGWKFNRASVFYWVRIA